MDVVFSWRKGGFMEREHKGKSLIALPSDFTVVDIEATGYSPEYDEIIEIAAVKCRGFQVENEFSCLIKPRFPVNSFVSELTGITNEMLSSARSISSVLPEFIDFVGDDIIIAHNANFDVNFIYDNLLAICNTFFDNDFVDTMRISRLLHKDQKHHRLSDLCERYGIVNVSAHRSLSDCHAALACYSRMNDEINVSYSSIDDIIPKRKRTGRSYLHASDISATSLEQDENNPLYGKVCVFTGALEKMIRREAMQCVVNIGGLVADSVTKKTNFLILGNNDYCASIKDGKSSKQKKAEKLKLQGQDIEIIPENVFYDMLNE